MPTKAQTQEDQQLLEEILDRHSSTWIANQLAVIAAGKADHLRTNWQDHQTAMRWQNAANAWDRAEFLLRPFGV